jgi:hypothetical protein
MPHEIDDFAAQGTTDILLITGDGFACILSCLLIVYSGGFTFFLKSHATRLNGHNVTAREKTAILAIADDGFACVFSCLQSSYSRGRFFIFPDIQI